MVYSRKLLPQKFKITVCIPPLNNNVHIHANDLKFYPLKKMMRLSWFQFTVVGSRLSTEYGNKGLYLNTTLNTTILEKTP
ncbi:MAG: hypothetical protein GKC53_04975 [Neisseriaceae bacterium]|nr:MAG: hypothetical protein GKC53_04975 [Neisseriaceae bacterium]